MKTTQLIKLFLSICFIAFCFRLIYINGQIDTSIKEKYTTLYKLRGDPALDTAENRKRYIKKKEKIENQIGQLEKKKFPSWWNTFFSSILAILLGWWLRTIFTSLFKKRTA